MRDLVKVGSVIGVLAAAVCSQALVFSSEASNNATVRPSGPRSGTSGKAYFNVEGNSFGQYASFGVADFSVNAFGIGFTVADVLSLSISLTQSNAAFTAPGTVRIYLSTDTTTSIESTNTALKFDTSSLPGGVGSQLGTLYSLGTGAFTTTGAVNNGTVDTYSLTLDSAAKAYLISQLNTPGALVRLVITPETDGTAATWAGYTHSTYAGPTLTLDVAPVPEPATMLGLLVGAGALAARRRRK